LLHITSTPGCLTRTQHKAQLRIVLAGELIELACPRDLIEHIGHVGHGAQRIGKALHLGDELRKLDLVECTGTVGQLHTGLKAQIALAGLQRLPLLAVLVHAFNGKGLVAGTAGAGLGLQGHFTRNNLGHGDRSDRIDQRIQMAAALH
jgi:hypothetical protein